MMKKAVVFAFVLIAVLCCSYALADLDTPQNPRWKEGSTATATWDSVVGADYYGLLVHVYFRGNELGTAITGTTREELDVQQEIHEVLADQFYAKVQVSFQVRTIQYAEDGTPIYGAYTAESGTTDYVLQEALDTPTNLVLSDDCILTWDSVAGASGYQWGMQLKKTGEEYSGELMSSVGLWECAVDNGRVSFDFSRRVLEEYESMVRYGSISAGDAVSVRVRLIANPDNDNEEFCMYSVPSEWSNEILFSDPNDYSLRAPTNLVLSDHCILTWDSVAGASGYQWGMQIKKPGEEYSDELISSVGLWECTVNNGRVSFSFGRRVLEEYESMVRYGSISAGDEILVRFRLISQPDNNNTDFTMYSLPSEWSNEILFSDPNDYSMSAPTNLLLSDECVLSWDSVAGAAGYQWGMQIKKSGEEYSGETMSSVGLWECTADNGRVSYDFSSRVTEEYESMIRNGSISVGDEITVHFRLISQPNNNYTEFVMYSEPSGWSNEIAFSIRTPVESLSLSPDAPIIHCGNSFYIGKTIVPENAYYTSIDWSSSDSSIVGISDYGLITGIAPGTAAITAAIRNVSASVPVTVYTISSNIEDEEDQQEVIDAAGEIIDDIGNNEEPDLSNTDIDPDDVENLQEQIHEAIGNGDEFYVDLVSEELDDGYFTGIQPILLEHHSTCIFADGYDLSFEMYHQDLQGSHHRIGNITEFSQEIVFEFLLPTLPAIQSGFYREYTLLRIHENVIETIPVSVKNGRWIASSSCFSDFVLMYEDKEGKEPLSAPANTHWKEGSTATAAWDAVEGADYYTITVSVDNQEGTIGTTQTGTSETSVDVQQEIHSLTEGMSGFVNVRFSVCATEHENGEIVNQSNDSELSAILVYSLSGHEYVEAPAAPRNLVLSDDGELSYDFTDTVGANDYNCFFTVRYTTDDWEELITNHEVNALDSPGDVNVTGIIKAGYLAHGLGGKTVQVNIKLYIECNVEDGTGGGQTYTTEESEYSNAIQYYETGDSPAVEAPAAPRNLVLTDDGELSYDFADTVGASDYNCFFTVRYTTDDGEELITNHEVNALDSPGDVNVPGIIKAGYLAHGLGGKAVQVDIKLYIECNVEDGTGGGQTYTTEESEYSNAIQYYETEDSPAVEAPAAPRNLVLTDDGVLSYGFTDTIGANDYNCFFTVRYTTDDGEELITNHEANALDSPGDVNVPEIIKAGYLAHGLGGIAVQVDIKLYIECNVEDGTGGGQTYTTEESEYSNTVIYAIRRVEQLLLSPDEPIVYIGHTLFIGKTIVPEDGYYSDIDWASSDEDIVTVDENGQLKGISAGNAAITATIDDISASVPVTVYTISSNIEDSTTQEEVTETAGSIIDDIGNNENPDLSNTDIDPDDVENIQEQIHSAMENGDEFHADWWWQWYGQVHYRSIWEMILDLLGGGQYACGYDAGFEIYHEDNQGGHHTIGNITEFDSEIEFGFEMPELPDVQPGRHRDYSLVRIHNGQVQQIPVTISNGRWSGRSCRFSDFVLVYNDVDIASNRILKLPTALTAIESEAFAGIAAEIVIIPSSVTCIADDAFKGSKIRTIVGNTEYLKQYADEHRISFQEP